LISSGGFLAIDSGGKAVGDTIFSGGRQTVSRGGLASGALVNSGRIENLFAGAPRTTRC
jgi:autotransporter passenger strand-loop-strand repeat protein